MFAVRVSLELVGADYFLARTGILAVLRKGRVAVVGGDLFPHFSLSAAYDPAHDFIFVFARTGERLSC